MSKGNVQLCAFVASYFKPGLSSNASVAEYTNLSNPMEDRNSPGKRVPPPYGSQSASAASTARKRTSLIKPKAALIGRDCILGTISSIILTEYRGCVGVDIFLSDLPWNQLPWKGRLAHSCVTYRETSESSYVLPGGTRPSIRPPHTGGQPSRAITNPLDALLRITPRGTLSHKPGLCVLFRAEFLRRGISELWDACSWGYIEVICPNT